VKTSTFVRGLSIAQEHGMTAPPTAMRGVLPTRMKGLWTSRALA